MNVYLSGINDHFAPQNYNNYLICASFFCIFGKKAVILQRKIEKRDYEFTMRNSRLAECGQEYLI